MASTNSPQIVSLENDFSDYAVRSSTTTLAMIGATKKGPQVPTLVNSEQDLISAFGLPEIFTDADGNNFSDNMITDAIQFLREGNQLWVCRAQGANAAKAVYILDDGADETYLTFTALNVGTWANGYTITATAPTNATAGFINIQILEGSTVVEQYQNVAATDATEAADETNTAEARINEISNLFSVARSSNVVTVVATADESATASVSGVDDKPLISDVQDYLDLLKDTEVYQINLLSIPQASRDIPDTGASAEKADWNQIYDSAIQMCEYRGDCMVIVDPWYADVVGNNVTPLSAKTALIDGTSGNYDFDSSQMALYAPFVQVYDGYNRKNVWAAPSGLIAGQYSFNDRVSQAWYAPAGLNRGKLRLASDVSVTFSRSDLEALQAPRMITNPIRPIINEGITIWGQVTGQRKATAMNRVGSRRMLNYAKSTIAVATRVLLFELNDSTTWARFNNLVKPVIQYIKDNRGVYEFKVICDETTNPPAILDQNIMVGKILLKPTKYAEKIEINFNILNTGAEFDEFV